MPVNSVATAAMAGPATIGAPPTAAGPLGGFEAVLATLFGAQAGGATAMANPFQVSDADATKDEAPSGDASTGDPSAAAQSLLAAFVAPIVTPVATQPPAAGGEATGEAAPSQAAAPTIDLFKTPGDAAAPLTPGEPPAPTGATAIVPDAAQAVAKAAGKADPLLAALAPSPAGSTPQPTAEAEPPPPTAPAATQLADATAQSAAVLPPQAAAVATPKQDAAPKQEAASKPVANPAAEGVDGEIQAPDAMKANTPAAKAAQAAGEPGVHKREVVEAAPPQAQDAKTSPDTSVARAPDAQAPAASASHAPLVHAASLRGAPETVATLAAQILKKLDSRTTRFDMELEPYGMGKVDVRLEIGAQGRLTAAMAFENPQSAQELRNRANELSRALEQAGFDVKDGLSFDVADNPGNGANQNNSAQEQTRDAPSRGRAFLAALQNASGADAPPSVNLSYARLRASGVDIKI